MVKLAIIGTGGMANMHARRFQQIRGVRLSALCDIDEARVRQFAAEHAPDAAVFTDARALLQEAGINAVSIVAPDALHAPLAIEALRAGKHVLCEKPIATSYAEAKPMVAAAKKAGVINMVNFSYRNAPAIQKAAHLVQSGKIGQVVHVEASYLQSWLTGKAWGDWRKKPGFLWRLSTAHGSHGVLGDIGVHILDFVSYPAGPIISVQARLKTFDKFKGKRHGAYKLDANDSALIQVEFGNGALGVVHTTRWATGHNNSLKLSIHGTKGALRVDLDRHPNQVEVCLGADIHKAKWRLMNASARPDIYQRFITSIRTGKPGEPDFARGAEIQKLLDACIESDRVGCTVNISG